MARWDHLSKEQSVRDQHAPTGFSRRGASRETYPRYESLYVGSFALDLSALEMIPACRSIIAEASPSGSLIIACWTSTRLAGPITIEQTDLLVDVVERLVFT